MRPYRIGLVAVHSTIDYPRSLRLGVQNTLEELGHTLVPVAELVPYHTPKNGESYMRMALDIARHLELDAVIVPVGCIAPYVGRDAKKAIELARTMPPENTLLLERDLPGYRCVIKDNAPGMHSCMKHLIETCGFTRIGFVSGPESSLGAREREAVYYEEMAAHGLPTPESLFVRGNFSGDCADVIEKLLDDNPDLQAIACACDLIAYTAYDVCRERKLTVGEDIAITGFDDHPRSSHLDPPLSTVHMTSYDLGCMAAREAVRLCANQPQEEFVLNSTFRVRNSCGEDSHGGVAFFRSLLSQDPAPLDAIVDAVMAATIFMAGPSVSADFRQRMREFLTRSFNAYQHHLAHPEDEVQLFSPQDLAALFDRDYREFLSLEGFHNMALTLLEAVMQESPVSDTDWVIDQISQLHLHIARMLSSSTAVATLAADERNWHTFRMIDGALREDREPERAHRLILEQFVELGVREADVFLLPEPIEFIGARSFALSDELYPIGRVVHGVVDEAPSREPISFQSLLDYVLPRYKSGATCTVGGIMAGKELLGIAALDVANLSQHDQLMAFLNLGFSLKHLQMIESAHEMNELLNRNNLLLQQESQHDEMTGLLNRRGFINRFEHVVAEMRGERAALVYLDLDGLKTINDTFGHDDGDVAIRATARILSAHMPEDALLCRLGGDEFVAFIPGKDDEGLKSIAHAIEGDMDACNAAGTYPFTLGISIGWVRFTIDDQTAARRTELLAIADERLYDMKRSHKASRRGGSQ